MGADQKRKEARKRKFAGRSGPAESKIETAFAATSPGEDTTEQPAAKKIKASKEPKPPDQRPREAHDVADGGAEDISSSVVQPADQQIDESIQDQPDTKSQRFIVFIGNLPFTATTESISSHFAKVQPQSIRHRTDKTTGKSKGFAFLEFEAYDRMKTCLKLYHHSNFEDGISQARKLNVELTVGGGGGKSKDRKAKLREKNGKLNDERARRAAEEAKNKPKKKGQSEPGVEGIEKKKREVKHTSIKGKGNKSVGHTTDDVIDNNKGAAATVEEPAQSTSYEDGDIHPSRRSRMVRR